MQLTYQVPSYPRFARTSFGETVHHGWALTEATVHGTPQQCVSQLGRIIPDLLVRYGHTTASGTSHDAGRWSVEGDREEIDAFIALIELPFRDARPSPDGGFDVRQAPQGYVARWRASHTRAPGA